MRRMALVASVVALLGSTGAACAADPPWIRPEGPRWDRDDTSFAFPRKTRRGLSGIACPAVQGERRICLAVFDEGTRAQFVDISGGGFEPLAEIVDLMHGVPGTDSGKELDAEGAAVDERFYYVTGSHSPKRRNCESNPASRYVMRFPYDPKTGLARRPVDAGRQVSIRLWPLMAGLPELRAHVGDGKCMGRPDHAVDIEGLAIRDGRLYFGFRGPALEGRVPVLSVDAGALFEGGDTAPRITMLEVGGGRGIRDMVTVADGILILAGPDDQLENEDRDWFVGLWDPRGSKLQRLARLDLEGVGRRACDDERERKPEAIAVLEESRWRYRVLILSDSLCDGGPLAFTVPR